MRWRRPRRPAGEQLELERSRGRLRWGEARRHQLPRLRRPVRERRRFVTLVTPLIGGLSSQSLVRVKLDGDSAAKADQWNMGARIREVEQGPDGALWLLEDGDRGSQGRMLKLTPAG